MVRTGRAMYFSLVILDINQAWGTSKVPTPGASLKINNTGWIIKHKIQIKKLNTLIAALWIVHGIAGLSNDSGCLLVCRFNTLAATRNGIMIAKVLRSCFRSTWW